MHRIDGTNHSSNMFTEGPPGTQVTGAFMNALQEEIVAVVLAAGIALDKPTNTQLRSALYALFGRLATESTWTARQIFTKSGAGNAIQATGGSSDGVAIVAVGGATNGDAIDATGTGTGAGVRAESSSTNGSIAINAIANGSDNTAISAVGTGGGEGINASSTGGGYGGQFSSSTGPAVRATGGTNAVGVSAVGNGTGHGTDSTGGNGASTYGVHGIAGTGVSAAGVKGISGGVNNIAGVLGETTHAGVNAVYGSKTSGNGASEAAVYGDGSLAGSYGVIASGDTSSPVRAALRLVPQDTAPSSPQDGDIYYDSGTSKLRVRAGGAWVDLH